MNKEQVKAKREEIRDTVAKWLRCKVLNEVECKDDNDTDCLIKWEDCNKFTKNYWLNLADEEISILSSLGLVIADKDAELPETSLDFWDDCIPEYKIAQQDMLQAGFTKTYPLQEALDG